MSDKLTAIDLSYAIKRGVWWDDAPNRRTRIDGGLTWNTTYGGWDFTNVSTRILWAVTEFPHDKRLGSSVVPHVHWQPTTAVVANVQWQLVYWYINTTGGIAQAAAGTTATITVPTNGVAYKLQLDVWPQIAPPATESLSAFLISKLTRLGAADAYNSTVILKSFDVRYQKDSLGSWAQYAKWG